MAIGLNDLKKRRIKKQSSNPGLQKDKKLTRPWESFDPFKDQVSTTRALEAILKAKEKNDQDIETQKFDQNLHDDSLKRSIITPKYQIKYHRGPPHFIKFILDLIK